MDGAGRDRRAAALGRRGGCLGRVHGRPDADRVAAPVGIALTALPPAERTALTLYYGLDGRLPRSQAETAACLGTTRWRVQRVLVSALARLDRGGTDRVAAAGAGPRADRVAALATASAAAGG